MTAPLEAVAARVLDEHFYGAGSQGRYCRCGAMGTGDRQKNYVAHVAAVLAEAGVGFVAEVERERDRLKRGGAELGKSLHFWMELARKVTDSDDLIEDDGDGDWGGVAERLAEMGEAERERDGSFWVGGREVTRADYLALTGALEYGDDGFQSPAAHPRDLIDPLQQAMYDAREHYECPMLCELCGETLAVTTCEHCNGSGCGPGTASGAYEECEWCAGAGRIHEGCDERSYGELLARAERAEAALEKVRALADRADARADASTRLVTTAALRAAIGGTHERRDVEEE